jgi:hypothetical protein
MKTCVKLRGYTGDFFLAIYLESSTKLWSGGYARETNILMAISLSHLIG